MEIVVVFIAEWIILNVSKQTKRNEYNMTHKYELMYNETKFKFDNIIDENYELNDEMKQTLYLDLCTDEMMIYEIDNDDECVACFQIID